MKIRPANSSDFEAVRRWLGAEKLPVADLASDAMGNFLVAERDGVAVGAVGLEQYGPVGLLRSLVVDVSARGAGAGRLLVAALEEFAAARQVQDLWLLTIDADRFFSQLGYAGLNRDEAPEAIRNTTEFSTLCPGDAVLMKKRL